MSAKVYPNSAARTAICEIDTTNIQDGIEGLEAYRQAFVVFRFKNAVVGQAWLPVIDGKIPAADLQPCLRQSAWPIWQRQFSPENTYAPSATVVVCTRNRTDDLSKGLRNLARLAEDGCEVLIVDNCPDDERTQRLVGEYPAIRYVLEPVPGLNNARNLGLKLARGDIVAFTDDDAVIDDGWLAALLQNFEDPTVAVVTGIAMPLELETEAQNWFEMTHGFGRGFERRQFEASNMTVLAAGRVGAGVNMAIRKSALAEIGYFDEALDAGTITLSGGDQEFFFRTLAAGYRIVYEPAALVWHRHRRTWEELRSTLYGYGVGVYAWWARALLVEGEWMVLYRAPKWFFQYYTRNLVKSISGRPGSMPLDLAWAEFRGALVGPLRYLQSRRRVKRRKTPSAQGTNAVLLDRISSEIHPSTKPES